MKLTIMSESAAVTAISTVLYVLVIVDIVGNSVVCAIIKRNRDMRYALNEIIKGSISRCFNERFVLRLEKKCNEGGEYL